MRQSDDSSQRPAAAIAWPVALAETLALVLIFTILAGAPPPDVNEAHYLGKARHFWDPSWVPDDFFFDSHDTHLVFYLTLGWLSRIVSLPAMAWIGRLLTWAFIALAWRRLSIAIIPRAGWAVLSGALFAVLAERFHMAGEWVVGGFEAKGIAYAMVLMALGDVARGRWQTTWLWLGAASAFHVLVGGWSVIAIGFAWLVQPSTRPKLISMLPWMLAGGLLALPGLWPALAVSRGVSPSVAARANHIYVFDRLPHHLWPPSFDPWFVERHALEFLVWVALCAFRHPAQADARVRGAVAGAMVISLCGMGIAFATRHDPATAASLMRFYWFRLGDIFLPLGTALIATLWMTDAWRDRPRLGRVLTTAAVALLAWQLTPRLVAHFGNEVPPADARNKVVDPRDWREACAWIAANTPSDARFLTPRSNQTFKWWSGRSEVATWKDIPQKADEMVAWWDRLRDVFATGRAPPERVWYKSLTDEGPQRLKMLGHKYGARYVIAEATPELALARVYQNNSYAVYELPQ
jgi:hypothetical protein